ncbi:hypothetical protein L1276_004981 [Flavobacterium sp. HSC-32F16]|uniref:hypothetical protein n=1 Tax=Flavobacterium sp. HSC-32F16 TaxID=2910964 RepID=UPI0020A24C29|nr:hypothetical protein [Flavobacterium sp. HSC-32F16]MCP2029787.1 hypothetical protein [Flavobacterium sp. HSC-32F16]
MRILAKENAETFGSPPISALGATGVSTFGISTTGVCVVVFTAGLSLLLLFSSFFEVSG